MCGIAGFLESNPHTSPEALKEIALRMASTLRHRGPDDGGAWEDASAGIALSMRRLAILDSSPAGHQPMQSHRGRYVIVFNGEIYNCEDLRRELLSQGPQPAFRGHSDTEVMLAAFECWGVRESLRRFNGMFAFALWDRQNRTLTLARDRFGEKPLFYALMGSTLSFASELKALRAHPQFSDDIDSGAMALYLRHNCIPAPYCDLSQYVQAAPGNDDDRFRFQPYRKAAAILVASPNRRGWCCESLYWERTGGYRGVGRLIAERRQDSDVLRCSPGSFSLRWYRLVHGGFADASAE